MNTATVTVYLNDGPYQFRGFGLSGPARLRPVTRFGVEVAEDVPAEHVTAGVLEIVFEQLNIDQPQQRWAVEYRAGGYRSLSVGDVVAVGETAWACCSLGWRRLSTHELRAAVHR